MGATPRSAGMRALLALPLADSLQLVRPRQWVKNLIIFAAPAAGGVLLDPSVGSALCIAFVLFCVTASGVYCVNDALDAPHDRLSSSRSSRPVAAGRIAPNSALITGVVLLVAGLVGAVVFHRDFALLLATYVVLTTAYSAKLKEVVVLDLGIVTSGFLLRAIAGGVVSGIALSQWFLVVATFGALFLVAGKRYAQRLVAHEGRSQVRSSLTRYSASYLRYVWTLSSGVTVTAYCLWSIESPTSTNLLYSLSVVPFTLTILRYALLVEEGRGEAPEDLLLRDRPLQFLGLAWFAMLGLAIYQ